MVSSHTEQHAALLILNRTNFIFTAITITRSMFFMRAILAISICVVLATTMPSPSIAQVRTMNALSQPRYKENPVCLFFENYILDVVGHLPAEKSKAIQAMNLQKVFKTKAAEWHESLREVLGLSPTIDIAILDLWYRNQDIARVQGIEYPAEQFAMNFTDEYMKEGSLVDIWPPGALEAAKQRIKAHQARP